MDYTKGSLDSYLPTFYINRIFKNSQKQKIQNHRHLNGGGGQGGQRWQWHKKDKDKDKGVSKDMHANSRLESHNNKKNYVN